MPGADEVVGYIGHASRAAKFLRSGKKYRIAVEFLHMVGGKRMKPDYCLQIDFCGAWRTLFYFDLKTTCQKFSNAAEAGEKWLKFRHWEEGKINYGKDKYVATVGRFPIRKGLWSWVICDSDVPSWFEQERAARGGSWFAKKKK